MSYSPNSHRIYFHTMGNDHYFHCVYCNEMVKVATYPVDKKKFAEGYFDTKCSFNGKKGAMSKGKADKLFKQFIGGTLSEEDEEGS